jgi:hypothetical protein
VVCFSLCYSMLFCSRAFFSLHCWTQIDIVISLIGCPVSHYTNSIVLGGIRPNSFMNISCVMTFRFRFSKTRIPQGGFLWPFVNGQNRFRLFDNCSFDWIFIN